MLLIKRDKSVKPHDLSRAKINNLYQRNDGPNNLLLIVTNKVKTPTVWRMWIDLFPFLEQREWSEIFSLVMLKCM